MAPGSILSTQIPSNRYQYDVYKISSKKIEWKVSVGGVKVENGSHKQNTQFYKLFEP